MLERLLSRLKKHPQSPEKPSEDLLGTSTDTNLIANYGIEAKENEAKRVVLSLKISLIALTFIYIAALFTNQILNYALATKKVALQDSYKKALEYKALEDTALVISKKLAVYQKIADTRLGLTPKMEAIYSSVDPGLGIDVFKIALNQNTFTLTLSGKNVSNFSKVIYSLLYQKTYYPIKMVSIKSAVFNTRSDSYVVIMEGTFK